MIQAVVLRMYSETEENRFLEVTYANGDKEVLYFKDFNSGAMIQNIVDRAKKMAIKEFLVHRPEGAAPAAPARRLRRRVPRERGPAQHHQPRRLGPHLRQEGRADRLHPHARLRRQGHRGRPVHRDGHQHRPVPVSSRRDAARTLAAPRVAPARSVDRPRSAPRVRVSRRLRPAQRPYAYARPARRHAQLRRSEVTHERAAGHGHRGRVRHLGARPARRQPDGDLVAGGQRLRRPARADPRRPGPVGLRGGVAAARRPRLHLLRRARTTRPRRSPTRTSAWPT